jgi:hypothetical protein
MPADGRWDLTPLKGVKSFSFMKSEDSLLCMQEPVSGHGSEPDGVNISAVQASCTHVALCFAKLTVHTGGYNTFFFFLGEVTYKENLFACISEPDGRLMVLVVTDTNTLLVYERTRLLWSAQLVITPVCVRRATFEVVKSSQEKMVCALYDEH